jgi:hypothetical protein
MRRQTIPENLAVPAGELVNNNWGRLFTDRKQVVKTVPCLWTRRRAPPMKLGFFGGVPRGERPWMGLSTDR